MFIERLFAAGISYCCAIIMLWLLLFYNKLPLTLLWNLEQFQVVGAIFAIAAFIKVELVGAFMGSVLLCGLIRIMLEAG